MIEVQIKNKEIYEKLKGMAGYSSDITQVCAFRDEMLDILLENGIEVDNNFQEQHLSKKPVLTIVNGKVMKLENAPAEMLYFVGVRSELDPTIPIRYMHEVNLILESHLVDVSKKFLEVYGKLGYRSKIQELVCAKVKFQGKGKLVDYIDGSMTLQSMQFPHAITKKLEYKQMLVKVVRRPDRPHEERAIVLRADKYDEVYTLRCDKNGKPIDGNFMCLRFYARPVILKSILYEGNKFNIACMKITENQLGHLTSYDPLILPRGLVLNEDTAYSPPNRSIPAELYRNALFEFQARYNFVYGEGN